MAITFNADEILSMAERIARNGHRFYERGIAVCEGAPTRELFERLAGSWARHENHFAAIRASVSDEDRELTSLDPVGEAELYLQAMADSHVFTEAVRFEDELSCDVSNEVILEKALSFEKDTTLFFVAMAKLVPARLGKDVVERLIADEMEHVTGLMRERNRLRAPAPDTACTREGEVFACGHEDE